MQHYLCGINCHLEVGTNYVNLVLDVTLKIRNVFLLICVCETVTQMCVRGLFAYSSQHL